MTRYDLSGENRPLVSVHENRRSMFVGLDDFGCSVIKQISREWAEGKTPQFSCCPTITLEEFFPDLASYDDRREVRKKFIESKQLDVIRQRIREAVEICARMPPIGQGRPIPEQRLDVYVIVDIAESFGSAILFDVAAMLKMELVGRKHALTAVLSFEQVKDGKKPAHTYAILREVEHCQLTGFGDEFGRNSIRKRPFDACLLISDQHDTGRLPDLSDRVQVMAHLLSDFCINDLICQSIDIVADSTASSSGYGAVGMSSAYFPYDELRISCLSQWTTEICNELLISPSKNERNSLGKLGASVQSLNKIYTSAENWLPKLPQQLREISEPDFRVKGRSEIAKTFQDQRKEFLKRSSEVQSDVQMRLESRFVKPLCDAITQWTGRVVRKPHGIAFVAETLDSSRIDVSELLEEVRRQADEEKRTFQQLNSSLQNKLNKAVSSKEAPLGGAALPPPYRLIRRWREQRRINQTKAKWEKWYEQRSKDLTELSEKIRNLSVLELVERTYEQIDSYLVAQIETVKQLWDFIRCVPKECRFTWRMKIYRPTMLDKDILTNSEHDKFCTHILDRYGVQINIPFLKTLLSDYNLFDGFPNIKLGDLANCLGSVAEEQFKEMGSLTLREQLKAAGVLEKYTDLYAWVTEDVWNYAAPLLTIEPSDKKRAENEIVKIAVFRPPNMPELQKTIDNWRYSPNSPKPDQPTVNSAKLCRVVYGFQLRDIPWLKVCRSEYDGHKHREQLHIFDWQDKLPDVTEEP